MPMMTFKTSAVSSFGFGFWRGLAFGVIAIVLVVSDIGSEVTIP